MTPARKPPVDWEPGTEARLTYTSSDSPPWPEGLPLEGDLLRSEAGACYVIEEVRQSPSKPEMVRLVLARLEYGSLGRHAEGVWNFHWTGRR